MLKFFLQLSDSLPVQLSWELRDLKTAMQYVDPWKIVEYARTIYSAMIT